MNALERNAETFAHRGQRICVPVPLGLELHEGDAIHIRLVAAHGWDMPARVISADAYDAVIEPGASVSRPDRWHIVAPSFGRQRIEVSVPQFDLFGFQPVHA
jgi:hypothetical protein